MIAPTEKVSRPRVALPQVQLHERGVQFGKLLARAESVGPVGWQSSIRSTGMRCWSRCRLLRRG